MISRERFNRRYHEGLNKDLKESLQTPIKPAASREMGKFNMQKSPSQIRSPGSRTYAIPGKSSETS